jgi:hypothetical protein
MAEMVDRILDVMLSRGLMAGEDDVRAILDIMYEPTAEMLRAAKDLGCAEDHWQIMILESGLEPHV